MKIQFINFPHVFTSCGSRFSVHDFINQPVVGGVIDIRDDRLYCLTGSDSGECASGLCDLKIGG